ncbi:hypothetical protein [Pedobacter suwonensis]|uniref:hypothetical protein n=1 Tax=Pedobacter suwonensis TaxID=332999 RepID=UPI0036BEAF08
MIDEETKRNEGFSISRIAQLESDSRLLSTHISILTAIFICWQHNAFREPFSVTRRKLMALSKVASIATYHKCMRELIAFGYITYQPSFHPQKGSLVGWSEPK